MAREHEFARMLMNDIEECILWPYAKTGGYASLTYQGRLVTGHVLVCEMFHGFRPEGHEVAHSCGNRACINPRHLRWATRKENMADKRIHGTLPLGESHHNSKLTLADVEAIRAAKGKVRQVDLAAQYGIHQTNVSLIQTGKAWNS